MCFARQFALATALTGSLTLLAAPSRATPPEIPPYHAQIPDTQPIRRTYYALSDHPVQIRAGSLLVFRDDRIQSNNTIALRGVARLDPSRPSDATNPGILGNFDLLRPFEDYDVIQPWVSLSDNQAPLHVLQLTRPLHPHETLGVAYVDELPEEPVQVGEYLDPDSIVVKALAIAPTFLALNNWGLFDPEGEWFPVLGYELQNFYDLGTRDIPMDRLRIEVRRIVPGAVHDVNEVFDKSLIEHLGLDQRGTPGSGSSVPDGIVDDTFVDPVRGLLFFPDHHPFDPDTTSLGCPPGRGGFHCLDHLDRNVLRRWNAEPAAQSNELVYYDPNPVPAEDTRFYLDITILPLPKPGALLHPNAPNPFNPGTTITFDLNLAGRATLEVFDVHGRHVRRLVDGDLQAGPHQAFWTGEGRAGERVSSGVYFYVLEAGDHRYARKMVLAR